MVHAQVSDVSRLLVPRVMTELFYCLAQEVLICWRAVGGFSIGGMLQVCKMRIGLQLYHIFNGQIACSLYRERWKQNLCIRL